MRDCGDGLTQRSTSSIPFLGYLAKELAWYVSIDILRSFTDALRQVFPPAQAIFAGAGVLLLVSVFVYLFAHSRDIRSQAAKEVEASQDLLIDIFERIENFFRRLEIYTNVPPTPAMTDMMVKIMVEVLDILATATKEMKQSRFSESILLLEFLKAYTCSELFLKRVAGITKLDDGLQKLDKMTNEEARMANAEVLRLAHKIDGKVEGVDNKVQGVCNQVKEVDQKVRRINKDVQVVSAQVQGVDENVKIVEEKVQAVIDGAQTTQQVIDTSTDI